MCVLFEHSTIGSGSGALSYIVLIFMKTLLSHLPASTFSCYFSLFRFLPRIFFFSPRPPQLIRHLDKSLTAPLSHSYACTSVLLSQGSFLLYGTYVPNPAHNSNEGKRWQGEEVQRRRGSRPAQKETQCKIPQNPFPFSFLWANTPGGKPKRRPASSKKTNLFISWMF